MHPMDEETMKQIAINQDAHTHHEMMDNAAAATGAFKRDQPPPPPIQSEEELVRSRRRCMGLDEITEAFQAAHPTLDGVDRAEAFDLDVVDDVIAHIGGKLTVENVRGLINAECQALLDMLLEKNAAYGNSALDPVRVFSKATPIEQIFVRLDDKLSRLKRGDMTKVPEEALATVVDDILGYLILLKVAMRLKLE